MTQTEQILAHLQSGKSLTPLDALRDFGCLRLAARIYDLIEDGHDIITTMQTDGLKRWACYSLIPRKPAMQCAEDGQRMLL